MPGLDEGRGYPGRQSCRLGITDAAAEEIHAVERVEHGIQRLNLRPAIAPGLFVPPIGLFFLQTGRIQHHQAGQLAARCGRDDLAAKTARDQQRDAPAMIEMRVRQQQVIDIPGFESERLPVFLLDLAAALIETTVDQDALPGAFHQVTGAGHATGRPMK